MELQTQNEKLTKLKKSDSYNRMIMIQFMRQSFREL